MQNDYTHNPPTHTESGYLSFSMTRVPDMGDLSTMNYNVKVNSPYRMQNNVFCGGTKIFSPMNLNRYKCRILPKIQYYYLRYCCVIKYFL